MRVDLRARVAYTLPIGADLFAGVDNLLDAGGPFDPIAPRILYAGLSARL